MNSERKTFFRNVVLSAFRSEDGAYLNVPSRPGGKATPLLRILASIDDPDVMDHLLEAIYHAFNAEDEDAVNSLLQFATGIADTWAEQRVSYQHA